MTKTTELTKLPVISTTIIDKIIDLAVKSLAKHNADVNRAQWLQEAEAAKAAGAPLISASIVQHSIG
jgi:pre-mRNA-processing factor 6